MSTDTLIGLVIFAVIVGGLLLIGILFYVFLGVVVRCFLHHFYPKEDSKAFELVPGLSFWEKVFLLCAWPIQLVVVLGKQAKRKRQENLKLKTRRRR